MIEMNTTKDWKKLTSIKKNSMKPIGKYILIKTIQEEIKSESGLILSAEDVSQLRYKKGTVVEPGSDVDVIKSGDTIYYDSSSGYTMVISGKTYTIIKEFDVVVVL
jgi:co-chaperonin GroES (HSP10)|tara:strand:+ start:51 stop:368 length:318 start_codon:yes stop_codon:yes gene_type:complete